MRRHLPVLLFLVALLAPGATARAEVTLEPVADGFEFATNVAVAPDGTLFVTEKDLGRVLVVRDGRVLDTPFYELPVIPGGETGLLGIALHPNFPAEPWVYVYLSDPRDEMNRVVRIRAQGDLGTDLEPVLTTAPAVNGYHNGGDIVFGRDATLFVASGEAHEEQRAQDPGDLGGKILRVDAEGDVPADNPLAPDSPVYALGIRNSFGLCVDLDSGALWETENGPDRYDEVNRIEPGANYGWPDHLGPEGAEGFVDPVLAYEAVIVPTGCAVLDGELWFGTYGGELHRVTFDAAGTPSDRVVARTDAGITDVARTPVGGLLVVTQDAIYRVTGAPPSATASSDAPTPTDGGRTPTSPPGRGGSSAVAALLVGALLVGGLLVMRARLLSRR